MKDLDGNQKKVDRSELLWLLEIPEIAEAISRVVEELKEVFKDEIEANKKPGPAGGEKTRTVYINNPRLLKYIDYLNRDKEYQDAVLKKHDDKCKDTFVPKD